jgi:hypothetical protein
VIVITLIHILITICFNDVVTVPLEIVEATRDSVVIGQPLLQTISHALREIEP